LVELPRRLQRERFDVIVSLTNTGPVWSPIRHLFFQRNALFYCSYSLSTLRGRHKVETILRRRLAIESMKRASTIVTPSDSMAQMIKDCCPNIRTRQFKTLYHGFACDSMQEREELNWTALLQRPGLKLLYPTHAAAHKGFYVLFSMLEKLRRHRTDFTLFTTIAHEDWPAGIEDFRRRVDALGIGEHVVFMGRVPQGQMGALYQRCDLMVYPSLCESFGFSLIEAMGHGLPIVAAGTALNREMCGGAALYYDPMDHDAGAGAIQRALDPMISAELVDNARRRVNCFDWSWQRYARQFAQMVGEAAC
jgi:glycosyltransferase involved in cell wall biosynthesis